MSNFFGKIIIIFIIFQLIIYVAVNREFFSRKFDASYYSDLYSKSQYVLGPASKGGIGDDGLYTFAGYYYLFQKGDVSAVNFEHPPLGKYLIGVSLLLFQNENVINFFYYILLLFITYYIGKIILNNDFHSLLAVGFLSSNLLILDNLKRSLLDLPFTLFFTISVYFFLLGLRRAKFYFLSMLFWGITFSTRFFPSMVIIYIFLLTIIIFYDRKNLSVFISASFLIPLVYLISHISFFIYHPSLFEFLRHKKWMLTWFTGSVTVTGNIWVNIFSGHYFDSDGRFVFNEHWNIFTPFIVVFSLLPIKRDLVDKKNLDFLVLSGVSLLFLIYLTFLTFGLEKFLMPIYPLLSILAVSNLVHLYSIIIAWRRPISKTLKAG